MIQFKSQNRSSKYKKNSLIIVILQALGMGLNLLLIPITLNYLGVEEFGVWITLVTIISWFVIFDIGLGHGLRNRYAEAKASNSDINVKKYVSTAFFIVSLISIIIFIIFFIVSWFVDWSIVLNAPSILAEDLRILSLCIAFLFCLRLVLNIVNTLLTADQNPYIPASINFIGQGLSLLVVYLISIYSKPSILYLGLALSISQLFPLLVAFILFFSNRYQNIFPSIKYFSKPHIKSIFSLGLRFFAIQITALILFQSNNIIIAHVCGLSEVSQFNIAFKYLNILFVFFSAFLNPLWSASTEAYVKGEIDWIKKSIDKLNKLWLILIAGGIIMILISPIVYKFWLNNSILPDSTLLGLLLLYFIFLSRSTLYRSFMNGVGKISLQFIVTLIQALLHIPAAIILGKYFGIAGVVSVMLLWVIINSFWEQIQFKRIINKTAKGIWDR